MLEQVQDNTISQEVKLLWDELIYIQTQLNNLHSDLRYVMALIEAAERELSYVKVGVPCPQ